jgi:toxin secretion/phage lysis holin|nr:MAG TPA: holin [Caudoviricetes sp.]
MTTADVWCAIAVMFFIATDYVTGMAKAIMQDNLSSEKMREGLGHKFAYIILTLTAWFIDEVNLHVDLGLPVSVFVCTVGGICLIELTSILENITEINPELADAPFMQIFAKNDTQSKHGRK